MLTTTNANKPFALSAAEADEPEVRGGRVWEEAALGVQAPRAEARAGPGGLGCGELRLHHAQSPSAWPAASRTREDAGLPSAIGEGELLSNHTCSLTTN